MFEGLADEDNQKLLTFCCTGESWAMLLEKHENALFALISVWVWMCCWNDDMVMMVENLWRIVAVLVVGWFGGCDVTPKNSGRKKWAGSLILKAKSETHTLTKPPQLLHIYYQPSWSRQRKNASDRISHVMVNTQCSRNFITFSWMSLFSPMNMDSGSGEWWWWW